MDSKTERYKVGDTVEPTPDAPPMTLDVGHIGHVIAVNNHPTLSIKVQFRYGTASYRPEHLRRIGRTG
ncbi:MAG: hypothetical protein ACREP9_06660 [Candidatus Dormibacteraceae bacterium]